MGGGVEDGFGVDVAVVRAGVDAEVGGGVFVCERSEMTLVKGWMRKCVRLTADS